jgi:hypothetical protein
MELETVINYVTNSVNPDGVRAQEIKESLEEDIQEELDHARQFASRIKELYGVVPGTYSPSVYRPILAGTNIRRQTTAKPSRMCAPFRLVLEALQSGGLE